MNKFNIATALTIANNRDEIWAIAPDDRIIVVVHTELHDRASRVNVYDAITRERFVVEMEKAIQLIERRIFREIVALVGDDCLHEIWMSWRDYRKPIERQREAEKEAAEEILLKRYEKIASYDVIERHRLQTQVSGQRYLGVRSPEENEQRRQHRRSHCWNCHRGLDNYRDYECKHCSWILCQCGACNCGRHHTHECTKCGNAFRQIDCRGSYPFCSPSCRYATLQEYSVYLRSDSWSQRRAARLELDNYSCADCNAEATEVHHLTYNRIGDEAIDDLISLCSECHAIRHGEIDSKYCSRSFVGKLAGYRS
jgi:hypothetical protein